MDKRGKRQGLRGLAVSLALLLLAAACSSDGDSPSASASGATDETFQVAFFNYDLSSAFTSAYGDAITDVAEANGVELTVFDAAIDAQNQFRQVQDAVATGKYDGFVVYPVDGPSLVPAVEEAIDAGISLVSVGSALGEDNSTADPQVEGQVGAAFNPVVPVGADLAQLVVEACADKDPCEAGFLLGDPSFRNSIELLNAAEEALADHPNVEIVTVQEGGYLAGPAYDATQDMMQSNPDIDVITSDGDQMIAGAEKALVDMDKEPGKDVLLVGTGASEIAVQGIKDGTWFGTSIWLPYSSGTAGMEMLLAALRGESIEDTGVSDGELSDRGPILTPENVEGFEAEWAG